MPAETRTAAVSTGNAVGNMAPPPPTSDLAAFPSSRAAHLTFAILACMIGFAYVDTHIFALIVHPIEREFGVSDTQIGMLQGFAFRLSQGIAAFPMGALVDRKNRLALLTWVTLGWSSSTFLSGMTAEFWQLAACRVGIGISEAGLYAACYSLIADLYPPRRQRTMVMLFVSLSVIGTSAATYLCGVIVEVAGEAERLLPWADTPVAPWRICLFLAAIPGFILAPILYSVSEPERQSTPVSHGFVAATDATFQQFLAKYRTGIILLLFGLFAVKFGYTAFMFWLPTALSRAYGVATSEIGKLCALALGAGSVAGTIIAAILVHRIKEARGQLASLLQIYRASFLMLVVVAMLFLFVGSDRQAVLLWALYICGTYIASGLAPSLVSALVPNHFRGRMFALYNVPGLLCAVVAPLTVGAVADGFFPAADGLLTAWCIVSLPGALAGLLLFSGIVRAFPDHEADRNVRDEAALQLRPAS
ncbi:MAG: transporter [Sphingomonas bacterium]|nr:MFS transporter [Sphingomonas bacterium]MDB5689339.1 transporter [Sphingomonas bacterium]